MTTTLGIATITVIAAVGNPRPTPGSSKKIMLDAQIYDDIALYLLYAMIAKREDGAQIHPLADSKEKYDFVGDIQWIVPLTPLSSDCDNNTSFSIDPAQHAYLHILGVAVNCNEKEATFDVEIDQYISTLKDVKSSPSKFVTPFSCSIPDSPRYKTGKPVPYNRQYISISGFLTDVTYKPDSDVMQRFHLKVENIVFLSQQCNVMGTIPNSLDTPSRTPHTGKGLIDYKCKAPASPTTPTPVQGPPKKHCHLESKGSHSTVPPQFN